MDLPANPPEQPIAVTRHQYVKVSIRRFDKFGRMEIIKRSGITRSISRAFGAVFVLIEDSAGRIFQARAGECFPQPIGPLPRPRVQPVKSHAFYEPLFA